MFGSLQAGNPQTSNNVATLQSLAAFENGWDDAIEQGDKLPPLEEFQGIQYGISYQQAYMLQEGIAEWDASTPYYKGSLAKTISGSSFKLYCSLADNNTGNVVTNTTYWKKVMDSDDTYAFDNTVVHKTGTETISGNKTFSGSVYLGSWSTVGTPSIYDKSKSVVNSEWVRDNIGGSGFISGIPDYDSMYTVDRTFTPEKNGIMMVYRSSGYPGAGIRLNDSSGQFIVCSESRDADSGIECVWAVVKAGSTYYAWSRTGTPTVYFIPFL